MADACRWWNRAPTGPAGAGSRTVATADAMRRLIADPAAAMAATEKLCRHLTTSDLCSRLVEFAKGLRSTRETISPNVGKL
jgi:hypothetical protein